MINFGRTYKHFLVVFAVALFFTNMADFTEQYGVIPLAWIAVFAVLSGPAILHGLATSRITVRPIVYWCAFYVVISIAWYYHSPQDEFAFQEVQTRIVFHFLVSCEVVVFSPVLEGEFVHHQLHPGIAGG